jgi:hypothetical protein
MRRVGIVVSHPSGAGMGHPWFVLVSEFSEGQRSLVDLRDSGFR